MTTQTEAQQVDCEVENLVGRLISAGDQDGAKLVRRLLERHAHTQYWYGVRHKRLWHWAHDKLPTELREQYFCILTNGTADVHEEPTYAQQYNQMEWRMREAEKKLTELEATNAELLEALKGTTQELLDVLKDINNDRTPFDGDEFHERLEAGKAAIKKHVGTA